MVAAKWMPLAEVRGCDARGRGTPLDNPVLSTVWPALLRLTAAWLL